MKRVVLFTTPTSGTGSLWRIVQTFLPADTRRIPFIDDCLNRGIALAEIKNQALPDQGCILFNQPHLFNFSQDFSNTTFILNFRDPRDMSCNQYYWIFSHPNPSFSDEALAAHRDSVRKTGIDKFVLNQDHRSFFENHIAFSQNEKLMQNTVVCSYIQLCFNTDNLIDKVAQALECWDQDLIQRTKLSEHPSTFAVSNKWVGQKWEGSDLFPGRARVELRGETYAALTSRYARALTALEAMDDSRYAYFYGP